MASEKRELQRKNREKAMKKAKAKKTVGTVVGIIVAVAVVGGIGYLVWDSTINTTKNIEDYSAALTSEGMIEGVDVTTDVTLCDYKNITMNYEELLPSDAEVEADIASRVAAHMELSTEAGVVVNEGDKINLDYTGKVDGVPFENGSTNGAGTDIILGSAGYIDGFEDQVIGTKVGDSYTIDVTFPDNYSTPELQGKAATFDITVNGVYLTPEFDDTYVQTYLSDYASTADGYREYFINSTVEKNLQRAVIAYVMDNSTINRYPATYLKTLRGQTKYSDTIAMNNTNAQYQQYFGENMYNSVYEFKNMKKAEYEASLVTRAENMAKTAMIYQAIYQDAGLSYTQEQIDEVLADNWGMEATYYNQAKETYGDGFIRQGAMSKAVVAYLLETVNVEK